MSYEAESAWRPNAAEAAAIREAWEGPFPGFEFLRAVNDLNKEFTDNIRNSGAVVIRGPCS